MGHKVNPVGLRVGINRTWDSRWFAGSDYSKLLHDDLKLRHHLRTKLRGAGVSRVVIERPAKKPRVTRTLEKAPRVGSWGKRLGVAWYSSASLLRAVARSQ